MYEPIKRVECESILRNALKDCRHRANKWEELKTVCVIRGLPNCGKTTLLLNRFNNAMDSMHKKMSIKEN